MGLRQKKILITCGPTWVAVDPVRVISNCSSGALGHLVAAALKKTGARVTVLEGPVNCSLKTRSIRVRKFKFFTELATLLREELKKKPDAVIHAAAVADYQPLRSSKLKISSGKKALVLRLAPTPKLIQRVRTIVPKTFLVGFKLEPTSSRKALVKAARKLFTTAACDLVVANSITDAYKGYVVNPESKIIATAFSRQQLAQKLIQILKDKI